MQGTRASVGRYRFIAIFAAIFALGQLAVVTSRTYVTDWLVAAPAGHTLAALFPSDGVSVAGNQISSQRVRLNILPGCEGTELFLLLCAGVLAFPARWPAKLWGLVAGLPLAFVLNQLRVVLLYSVVRDHSSQFELVHAYVAPTAFVVCLGMFYWWWTAVSLPNRTP
jgi:exosortase family protein XrtM